MRRIILAAHLLALLVVAAPARGDPLRQLPGGISIPNGYHRDWHRAPHRYAAPADANTIVAFDLLRPSAGGRPRLSVTYLQESRMIGESANILRLRFEIRF